MMLHTLTGLVEYGVPLTQGRFHRDDVYMPMSPMFHVHAWGAPYMATLLGCKIVFAGRYTPEMFVKLIKTEKVTFTHCVPTILQMLLSAPGIENVDLSGLTMIVGGSALPPALARAALARGIDVFTSYGQSGVRPVAHRRARRVETFRQRFRGGTPLSDVDRPSPRRWSICASSTRTWLTCRMTARASARSSFGRPG